MSAAPGEVIVKWLGWLPAGGGWPGARLQRGRP